MIYAVRAYAPAESLFKKDLKMLRVRQEFECVNSLGQESNSQAVKEGGLMSIRDDESEGECRNIPHNSSFYLSTSSCVPVCFQLGSRRTCAHALTVIMRVFVSLAQDASEKCAGQESSDRTILD